MWTGKSDFKILTPACKIKIEKIPTIHGMFLLMKTLVLRVKNYYKLRSSKVALIPLYFILVWGAIFPFLGVMIEVVI